MKYVIALIFIIFFYNLQATAQYLNNKWLVGSYPLLFNFHDDTVTNEVYNTPLPIYFRQAHSNINDSSGLLFSCNGTNIYDHEGGLMENGDDIIPKKAYVNFTNQLIQASIIIPKKNNQYYQFVWGISDSNYALAQINGGWFIYDILTYSMVDLNENNGKGKVIEKMTYLKQNDSLSICQMNAVRHANGRDWWLVKPHLFHHRFYTYLVTPNTIKEQSIQDFSSPSLSNGTLGQGNFSPDGSLYVFTSEFNDSITQVNYFDRCTGQMTPFKTIKWTWRDSAKTIRNTINTACFSPNSQFVYLINNLATIQYDLTNDEQIVIFDTTNNPTGHTTSYNAPDGKIYIGNFHGTGNRMSYIRNPDTKGKGAGFCLRCYETKNINTLSPPNMPNYELGKLEGSPCDTIKPVPIDTNTEIRYVSPIVPNVFSPNGDGINDNWHLLNVAQLQQEGITLQNVAVYNRWGKEVFKSNDINFSWNGGAWESDSYYYFIKYKSKQGISQLIKGSINLIR